MMDCNQVCEPNQPFLLYVVSVQVFCHNSKETKALFIHLILTSVYMYIHANIMQLIYREYFHLHNAIVL